MIYTYSTEHVSAPERFEYWKEVVCKHCIPASSSPLSDTNFDGSLRVKEIGLIDICSVNAPDHYWERTAKHLRTGPDDDFWLGYCIDGNSYLEQGDRRAKIKPGDLFLYDAAQTFKFNLSGNNKLVRIPRHYLSTKVRNLEDQTAIILDQARPGILPLKALISQIDDDAIIIQADNISHRLTQTILDLLTISLELQNFTIESKEKDIYSKVLTYIKRNLRDPELSLEKIASAHHVSSRTITRAFARYDKSPISELWNERLIASRDLIANNCASSISEIALESGFSDFSHFSRAFKKRFGVPPQRYLLDTKELI
jgi:AraC-like DNA-binding protein